MFEAPRSPDTWWRRPDALRAFGYGLFALAGPDAADHIHGAGSAKPFTLAVSEREDHLRLRLTALNPVASAVLRDTVLISRSGTSVRFGDATVRIVSSPSREEPLIGEATYGGLIRSAFAPRVRLTFATPTTFKKGDAPPLPLPVPDLIIRSWARRWNRFCTSELQIHEALLMTLTGRIAVADARVETSIVKLCRGELPGFVGDVVLEAQHPDTWAEAERTAWAALVAYSRFCGTGTRTTQGMGLTLPEAARGARDGAKGRTKNGNRACQLPGRRPAPAGDE
ncbi:MAG: CRISPR system precrRNA processing endoribonuclease RAMP protein Cas6 [Actinomycetota bacterium]